MQVIKKSKADEPPKVILILGPSGSGKTELAVRQYPGHFNLQGGGYNPWHWYKGEKTILFDGLTRPWLGAKNLTGFVSGCAAMVYSYRIKKTSGIPKGTWRHLTDVENVVLTSVYHPRQWKRFDKKYLKRFEQAIDETWLVNKAHEVFKIQGCVDAAYYNSRYLGIHEN